MKFKSKASQKTGKRNSLKAIRENMQILVDRANRMVSLLREQGLENSPALINAMKTAKSSSEELFNVEDKKRFRELRREAARLDSFLSEAESQVKLASASENAFYAEEKYGYSFKKQKENMERTGFRFGTEDEDRMKFALKIFRIVKEEPDSALYFEKGAERFDSDTLLNLIYDAVEGYNPYDPEGDGNNRLIELAKAEARRAIHEQYIYEQGFVHGSPYVNKEKDILSEVKKAKTTEEFLKENKWALNW